MTSRAENPYITHQQQLVEQMTPELRAMYERAAKLVFPRTPQLWKLASGPWSTIVMQVMIWQQRQATAGIQELEVETFHAQVDEHWAAVQEAASGAMAYQLTGSKAEARRATANLLANMDLTDIEI